MHDFSGEKNVGANVLVSANCDFIFMCKRNASISNWWFASPFLWLFLFKMGSEQEEKNEVKKKTKNYEQNKSE